MRKTIKQRREQRQDIINYTGGTIALLLAAYITFLAIQVYGL